MNGIKIQGVFIRNCQKISAILVENLTEKDKVSPIVTDYSILTEYEKLS